jgi:hypothetical protein
VGLFKILAAIHNAGKVFEKYLDGVVRVSLSHGCFVALSLIHQQTRLRRSIARAAFHALRPSTPLVATDVGVPAGGLPLRSTPRGEEGEPAMRAGVPDDVICPDLRYFPMSDPRVAAFRKACEFCSTGPWVHHGMACRGPLAG